MTEIVCSTHRANPSIIRPYPNGFISLLEMMPNLVPLLSPLKTGGPLGFESIETRWRQNKRAQLHSKVSCRIFVFGEFTSSFNLDEFVSSIELLDQSSDIWFLQSSASRLLVFDLCTFSDTYNIAICGSLAGLAVLTEVMQTFAQRPSPGMPREIYVASGCFEKGAGDIKGSLTYGTKALHGVPMEAASQVFKSFRNMMFPVDPAFDEMPFVPSCTDILVVGGGISGLHTARAFSAAGYQVVLLERSDNVGGVWASHANKTSKVNTSEPAYRVVEKNDAPNFLHAPTSMVMSDLLCIASLYLNTKIRLQVNVLSVVKSGAGNLVQFEDTRRNVVETISANQVVVCVNRRLGSIRDVVVPNEVEFKGRICYGVSNQVENIDLSGRSVVIVGGGAFAAENARTAVERGAKRVHVLSRRRGSVMPSLLDYLNFVRPYDETYSHYKLGSARIFESWKRAFISCGVDFPECWEIGRVAPVGHSVSVSDLWLVAHHYRILSTHLGDVASLSADSVLTSTGETIPCDVLIKCTGFASNGSVLDMLGSDEISANGVVRENLAYVAEAVWDDASSYSNPFGSSYVEALKFTVSTFVRELQEHGMLSPRGQKVNLMALSASAFSEFIQQEVLPSKDGVFLREQVLDRTISYHKRCLPQQFVGENRREWDDLCELCESNGSSKKVTRPAYPFHGLIDALANEWLMPEKLPIGSISSLAKTPEIASSLKRWVLGAVKSDLYRIQGGSVDSSPVNGDTRAKSFRSLDIFSAVTEVIGSMVGSAAQEMSASTPLMELGLDSLGATQLVRTLSKKFGLKLPITLIFDYPTINTLAAYLSSMLGSSGIVVPSETPRYVKRSSPESTNVAIVGMSCRFPGGIEGPAMFWDVIQSGRSVVGKVPFSRWDAEAVAASDPSLSDEVRQRMLYGGFVDDLEMFDASFFRISPAEASAMDPKQRLLL
jgi:acyl carrier protein/uncharacterized protein YkvS